MAFAYVAYFLGPRCWNSEQTDLALADYFLLSDTAAAMTSIDQHLDLFFGQGDVSEKLTLFHVANVVAFSVTFSTDLTQLLCHQQ